MIFKEVSTVLLCYRKLIDSQSTGQWEQLLLQEAWQEYRLQVQNIAGHQEHPGFASLLQFQPQAARLHFLVSAAVRGYLQQLNGIIPDITDQLGRRMLRFERFGFEIVNADLQQASKFQVAINFESQPLQWIGEVAGQMILSESAPTGEPIATPTFQLAVQPFVSIWSVSPLQNSNLYEHLHPSV